MTYVELLTKITPNLNLYGGKGSNLIKLIEFGLNVPPGFIINSNSYRKFIQDSHLKNRISQALSVEYDSKDVMSLSSKIKALFLESNIPPTIITNVKHFFTKFNREYGEKTTYSVRSSANIEDLSKFSYAGQAESYLNNRKFEDILLSLKNCWVSLFSPQALLYFLRIKQTNKELSLTDLEMAVIVQKMINADISGVLFTANVINNNENQMLINSTWGLGETITNNMIIPDMIILGKKKFKILKKVIGEKEKISIANPQGPYTVLLETEPEKKQQCSINEKQVQQLYKLGIRIEEFFKYPQDIEWAIKDNVLYTLQSRPITTLDN